MDFRKGIELVRTESGDLIQVRKGRRGYRIVHPIKNIDGTWNYPNLLFGGWSNLFKLLIYLGIGIIIYFGISELATQCKEVLADPCIYCQETNPLTSLENFTINFTPIS